MRLSSFFIAILLMISIPTVGAIVDDDDIMEYLGDLPNQEYWDGDWSIVDKVGTPIKNTKSSDHIRGWIDIVGFEDMAVVNGTEYVNGTPADLAFVKCKAWHTSVDGTVVSFTSLSWTYDYEGNTTAAQHTKFHWKYKECTLSGCHWVHVYEEQTITYITKSPMVFNLKIQDVPIRVVVCNQSFQPVTQIIIPDARSPVMDGVMDVIISYNGSSTSRRDEIGFIVLNDRGTEYAEFVPLDDPTWTDDDNQTTISHFLMAATVRESNFNASNLTTQFRTPYETRNVTNYTIVEMDQTSISPNVPLTKVFVLLIGTILVVLMVVGVIPRVLSR